MYYAIRLLAFAKLNLCAAALIAMAMLTPAGAATIGVAVGSVGGAVEVGVKENSPFGLVDAIKYFIPLGDTSGTYGVGSACSPTGFGTCSDTGNGGGTLTMILRFSPVSTVDPSTLSVVFDDLDLSGANDPVGFLETLEVRKADNTSLTGLITDIGGLVTGSADTQQILSLSLGTLTSDPLFLLLQFTADSDFYGKNTPEYLIAMINSAPGGQDVVPLPAALPLFIGGLGVIGYLGSRRRKKKMVAAAL